MKIFTVTYKTGVSAKEGTTYKTLYYADSKKAIQMAEEILTSPSKAETEFGVSIRTINAE